MEDDLGDGLEEEGNRGLRKREGELKISRREGGRERRL